jgi:hypothetical protein
LLIIGLTVSLTDPQFIGREIRRHDLKEKADEKEQMPPQAEPANVELSGLQSAPTHPVILDATTVGQAAVTSVEEVLGQASRHGAKPQGVNDLPSSSRNLPSESEKDLHFHVNAKQLCLLRSWNLIPRLPSMSVAEISCKSRSDFLVKATAVGQVLWLFIQTLARGIRSLPISQLEIVTLAFSTCAFTSYLFSWHKPQDVQFATVLGSIGNLTIRQTHDLLDASGHSLFWHMLGFVPFRQKKWRDRENNLFGPIANDITCWDLEISLPLRTHHDVTYTVEYTFLGTGTLLASVMFGAVHCVAWNFQFATEIEKTLWRVASLVSTLILMIHPLVHTLKAVFTTWVPVPVGLLVVKKPLRIALGSLTLVAMVGYVVARLFLMVETFRSLFSLPPGAFVSTWPSSLPHIG